LKSYSAFDSISILEGSFFNGETKFMLLNCVTDFYLWSLGDW